MSRFRETKMVSFRLDLKTLSIIEEIAKTQTNGNKTWAVENIVNKFYSESLSNEFSQITNKDNKNEK